MKLLPTLKTLMLQRPRRTLAVAESLTCGRIQARVGEISGASGFFLGGITTYTLEEKVRHLGVNRAAARKVDCVSAAVAAQMACGVCRLFGSDLGVAITGYAEPAPKQKVVQPFAHWALAVRHRGRAAVVCQGEIRCLGFNRVAAQQHFADAVLAGLVDWLGHSGSRGSRIS